MKQCNLFSVAALSLLMGLAACSNEVLQNASPQPETNIKEGEQRVVMSISGLGNGGVSTRATSDVEVVEGETDINQLHIYSFVDLTAANPGATASDEDAYTLERIYVYKKNGTENDLLLTPVGGGYQISFGVAEPDISKARKRIFRLVANDGESRSLTAVPVATANRTSATTLGSFKTLKILGADLEASSTPLATPLVMVANAQCVNAATGVGSSIYTPDDLADNAPISAELTRRVARIDIRNNAINNFQITSLKLSGVGNSTLFGEAPDVTDSNGNYPLVTFNEKTITEQYGNMVPAALYAYPVKMANSQIPTVTVKGKLSGVEIELVAKFTEKTVDNPNGSGGLLPNTRYVVNIYNSDGNMRAEVSVADWNLGETINTEDLAAKLNASATLAAESGNTLTNSVLTIAHSVDANTKIATITGTSGDTKPITIIAPDWIDVSDVVTTTGTAVYELKTNLMMNTSVFNSGVITVMTYANNKKVITEYQVVRDYVDVTTLTGSFPGVDASMFAMERGTDADGVLTYVKLSPFGTGPEVGFSNTDFLIPENAPWIYSTKIDLMGSKALALNVTKNLGKAERSAVVTMRRYDADNSQLVTKSLKIVQMGSYTDDMLSSTAKIKLSEAYSSKGLIKAEEVAGVYTITVAGLFVAREALNNELPPIFTIEGEVASMQKPTFVAVEFDTNVKTTVNMIIETNMKSVAYSEEVLYPASYNSSMEIPGKTINFTITTKQNGVRNVKKCRLIVKSGKEGIDGTVTAKK